MKRRIITVLLLVALLATTLTACGSKSPVSGAKFTEVAQGANLSVTDIAKKYTYDEAITGAWEAAPADKEYSINFFKYVYDADAMNEYLYRTDSYEEIGKLTDGTNFNKCVCTSDGSFIVISRVDATLFVATVGAEFAEEINGIVSAMGY